MSAAAATPSLSVRRPVAIATGLTLAACLAILLISPKVLDAVGIPYGSSDGPALTRFHPATFLALAALAAWIVTLGPTRLLASIVVHRPGLIAYASAIVLLVFQAAIVQGLPISAVVDTFVLPLALFIGLSALPAPVMNRFGAVVHGIFLLNSAIAYVEYLTGWRLTPYYSGGAIITFDWRSTALFGHPLSNALATGTYLLILSGAGGRRFPTPVRALLLVFHLGAMAAFGGRTATILSLVLLAAQASVGFLKIVAGRRMTLPMLIFALIGATMLAIVGTYLVQGGIFDAFLHRFEDDSGSAATRVAMLSVFQGQTLRELIFATNLDFLASIQRRLGLQIGIESFVVAFFAYYGVITSLAVFAGLFAYSAEILRSVGRSALLPLVFFFVVSASSTGLSSKTTDFGLFTIAMLVLLDRRFVDVPILSAVPSRAARPPLPAAGTA